MMDVGSILRDARRQARLSQAELAARTGTSQPTISAYENGTKEPSLQTLERLLAAAGLRLTVAPREGRSPRSPTRAQLASASRRLLDVIALAEELPVDHERTLRYPRVPRTR
jgi:transcriptional regulator with XRE-family HTH domain